MGTTGTWTNRDTMEHTVTADAKSADALDSEMLGQGESYSFTFNTPGIYPYHCVPHPYMKATVTVTE